MSYKTTYSTKGLIGAGLYRARLCLIVGKVGTGAEASHAEGRFACRPSLDVLPQDSCIKVSQRPRCS